MCHHCHTNDKYQIDNEKFSCFVFEKIFIYQYKVIYIKHNHRKEQGRGGF